MCWNTNKNEINLRYFNVKMLYLNKLIYYAMNHKFNLFAKLIFLYCKDSVCMPNLNTHWSPHDWVRASYIQSLHDKHWRWISRKRACQIYADVVHLLTFIHWNEEMLSWAIWKEIFIVEQLSGFSCCWFSYVATIYKSHYRYVDQTTDFPLSLKGYPRKKNIGLTTEHSEHVAEALK